MKSDRMEVERTWANTVETQNLDIKVCWLATAIKLQLPSPVMMLLPVQDGLLNGTEFQVGCEVFQFRICHKPKKNFDFLTCQSYFDLQVVGGETPLARW